MYPEPRQPNDDDHCCGSHSIFAAAKLDVYRHERLAYTEPPQKIAKSQGAARRIETLKAMANWALAHM